MTVHDLKIKPEYYRDVVNGDKTFEIRKNDRDYKVGDLLVMNEFRNGEYTGSNVHCIVSYLVQGSEEFGLDKDWCVLGIHLLGVHKRIGG